VAVSEPLDEQPKQKLQLEVIRGGGGSGGKTAVAIHDPAPDDYAWPSVPGWFRIVARWHVARWRRAFQFKTPTIISDIMHAAEVPEPFRLLTYWRWGLSCVETIDANNVFSIENLSQQNAGRNILDEAEVTAVWLLSRNIVLTPTHWHHKSERPPQESNSAILKIMYRLMPQRSGKTQ
jgi:hypothetical protein